LKLKWNATTKLPEIQIEAGDLLDAAHLQEMINGKFLCRKCGTETHNNGWKVLKGYLESQKILLDKKIDASIETKQDEGRTRIQVAKRVGFDHFMTMADKVIAQAESFREAPKETTHETGNEYGD